VNFQSKIEKGKNNFAGQEIQGKTLAVIGLGAIGVLVANAATALGMKVIGYDPYMSVKQALKLSRELERRLAGAFGTTDQDPNAVTVTDALAALSRSR